MENQSIEHHRQTRSITNDKEENPKKNMIDREKKKKLKLNPLWQADNDSEDFREIGEET